MKLPRRQVLGLAGGAAALPFLSHVSDAQTSSADDQTVKAFKDSIDLQNARLQAILNADVEQQRSLSISPLLDLPGSGELIDRSWQVYAEAIRAKFTGSEKWANLQLVTIPEPVRWDDPDYSDYYLYAAGNDMPLIGVSRRPSAASFADSYSAFIRDIAAPVVDEGAAKKARDALEAADSAQQAHFKLLQRYSNRWDVYDAWQKRHFPNNPSKWLTMDEWYAKYANAALDADTGVINTSYAQAYYWLQKAYAGQETLIKDILLRFNAFAKKRIKTPKASDALPDQMKEIYPYEINASFPDWLRDAKANKLANTTFEITAKSDTYDYSKTEIAGAVGIGFGFFGIIAGGQRITIHIDTTHEAYFLGFDAQVAMFEFSPGDWFNPIALKNYRQGPFASGSQMERLSKTTGIFGPDGVLNFRAARYIVAYKPRVTVRFQQSDYHYFYEQTRGAAGFFIGPFVVGVGGYYKEETHIKWDSNDASLTIYDGPDIPQLLAVDCDVL
ncbi:hypothetical protein [Mesorhizobium sp. J8]|uniref:hypothetical protein n=1 Tax=Mesorhizobium sp. J8 TaxID=2777475 RepID=UPI001914E252|nr:hypothetical protein [Mesorhizobium sp. J8]BCM17832.1 hypothetical protein MJ8_15980 [Mesorhizobium sp. J8]